MSSINSSLSNGSGLDVQATVDQLIYTERRPERLMQSQQSLLDSQATALKSFQTKLGSLEDAVFALKDFTGPLNSRLASSSDSAVLTATATSSATAATHTITISTLATANSWYSKPITDPAFKFATGSKMTIQVGNGETKQLTMEGKTLDDAASYINGLHCGISATTINDANGTRLSIVSGTSGVPGRISFMDDSTALEWKTSSPGDNAQLTVDGIPVESTSNTVSGVVPGITLVLSKETGATPVRLTVGPDAARAKQAVNSFISAYNAVIAGINAQFSYDSSSNKAGVLAGDTTLLNVQSMLLSQMSYAVSDNGSVQNLRAAGVKMGDDGTLTLDSSILDDALKNNFADVRDFFQASSPEASGFAVNLDARLSELNSVSGPVAADLKGVQNSSKAIQDQIDDFEVRIAVRQQQLLDQYTRIDVMLRNFSAIQTQIAAQLGSLNTTK